MPARNKRLSSLFTLRPAVRGSYNHANVRIVSIGQPPTSENQSLSARSTFITFPAAPNFLQSTTRKRFYKPQRTQLTRLDLVATRIVSAIVVRESCNPVVGDGGLLGAGDTVEGARPEKGEMNWVRAHALLALAPEKTRPAWSRFLWGVKGATDYGTGGRATWHGYSIAGDSGKCHLWGGLIYVDFCDSHSLHGGIPHPIPAFPTLTYPLPLPRLRNSDVRPFHLPPPPLPHPHPILAAFYLCKDQLHGQRAPRNWAREGEVETCLPHAHGRTGP
ncbi:hypothetical protein FA13DRAFT_1708117 [Coprinellus micaceus]|uniref:Uncharacterized protein n=1 Tax=Coprinellus micaceus TaxID=71717 RepID=A0A4Y7TIE5_COPMI|nr:hypothetical protein FA13DRAFT_1708117 [Coprinellus micaceus]